MAIPAIPDAGKPWLGWAQGVDVEARKVADKADAAALATVATTGAYTDLAGKPTIPAAYTDVQAVAANASAVAAKANLQHVAAVVTTGGPLVAGSHNPVDATAGPITMTLPTGLGDGQAVSVEKVDSSANVVTVTGSLRGVAAQTLTLPWAHESLTLRTDSTGSWWPISGHKTKASLDTAYGPATQAAAPELRAAFQSALSVRDNGDGTQTLVAA